MNKPIRREQVLVPALALVLAALLAGAARAQVERVLPPEPGTESDLDAEARKRVRPAERNLDVLPPELSGSRPPEEGPQQPKPHPGR